MFQNIKNQRLWMAVALVGILFLLVTGLQNLEGRETVSIRSAVQAEQTEKGQDLAFSGAAFFIVMFALIGIVLFGAAMLDRRKRGLTLLFLLTAFFLFIYSRSGQPEEVQKNAAQLAPTPNLMPVETDIPEPMAGTPVSLDDFEPPQTSGFFLYLVSFGVIAVLMTLFWVAFRERAPESLPAVSHDLEEIGTAARLAMDDLDAGLNERDTVIACYARMSAVVLHSQNIERGLSRTAKEFALRLEQAGLPGAAVQRLTNLFETVRYGIQTSNKVDVNEARACLAEIAHYCGELQ